MVSRWRSSEPTLASVSTLSDARRHERRLGDPDEGLFHEQRDTGDRSEGSILQAPVDWSLIGSHGSDDTVVVSMLVTGTAPVMMRGFPCSSDICRIFLIRAS
jgi:hypothetical protein